MSRLPLPRSRAARAGLAVLAVLVAINVVGALIDALAPSPSGPSSSSFATTSEGLAAWGELARRGGVRVRALRDAPSTGSLPGGGTVAVMDADGLTGDEARALHAFAERGGRVVAGGRPGAWTRTLLATQDPPAWRERWAGDRAGAHRGAGERRRAAGPDGGRRALAAPRPREAGAGQRRGHAAARGAHRPRTDRAARGQLAAAEPVARRG